MQYAIGVMISLALTGWAARDAARRGRSWYGWSRLVFFTGIFGVIGWLVVRRHAPVTMARLGVWRSLLLTLTGVPLLVATLLTYSFVVTFLFQVARNEGQAMAPTLGDHESVLVNKMAYRTGEPRREDIVMHYYPVNPQKLFVKRVIGQPGETVRIVDGRVHVNDVLLKDDDYVPAAFRSHDDWGPQVIPEGYYFVLGDHRNNSSDSRHWGMVPRKYILGKVQMRR
ncbi:MAG: signal peptidase I [Acidobacteriota bacterium]